MTPQEKQQRTLNQSLLISLILAVIMLLLVLFGYGYIKNPFVNNDYVVKINGNEVSVDKLKLRPGKYHVTVTSSRYESDQIIKVGILGTTTLAEPSDERDPNIILSKVLGSSGLYGPPESLSTTWLENNTWLVAKVGPGSTTPIALHYQDNSWNVAYYESTGYNHDKSQLPQEVVTTLEGMTSSGQ